jgi:hypothetical protein
MMTILRALLDAGVALDPAKAPRYRQTAEEVFESLPILITAR